MWGNRENIRYNTMGHAYISGVMEKGILLKNISITGCCLECEKDIEKIKTGEIHEIRIKPEKASHTGEFRFQAECKWIRRTDHSCEMGFNVTASPTGKFFQNYVDYLTYHSTHSTLNKPE